jgi:metal-responsive CopG/Arc/MetJ family transcriptional regulator
MTEEQRIQLQVEVSTVDIGKLDTIAVDKADGTSRNELIRQAIKEFIQRNKK